MYTCVYGATKSSTSLRIFYLIYLSLCELRTTMDEDYSYSCTASIVASCEPILALRLNQPHPSIAKSLIGSGYLPPSPRRLSLCLSRSNELSFITDEECSYCDRAFVGKPTSSSLLAGTSAVLAGGPSASSRWLNPHHQEVSVSIVLVYVIRYRTVPCCTLGNGGLYHARQRDVSRLAFNLNFFLENVD